MKSNKIILMVLLVLGMISSCSKDELNVQNPNQPTPESATTETGIVLFAKGSVYINGFRGLADKYVDAVPGYFWSGAMGIHSLMGDEIGCEAANWYLNQIGCPDNVKIDTGTVILNPNSPKQQVALLRQINDNANQGANPIVHEWANMYGLNNACNTTLSLIDNVKFATNADVKKNIVKAWSHWWKGFAYSRIGSMYYAGLVNDRPNETNANFVSKEKMIEAANTEFDKASAILATLKSGGDYDDFIKRLIPAYNRDKVITPEMWIRSINSYKARNILVNITADAMTPAQWAAVLDLTNKGIQKGDEVFIGRTDPASEFLAASNGTVSAKVVSTAPGGGTYKLSERLVQDFKANDKRAENNFVKGKTWTGNVDRGNIFNTRYALKDGGAGLPGVAILGSKTAGVHTLYMAVSYEENELMKAEAKINSNDVPGGIAIIDAVRTYQGAGLAATVAATKDLALVELRAERRCGLAFRGLAFYDARRFGVINDVAKGGGRSNALVVSKGGLVNTKAVINYNYLDYWDVPANELAYNPAAAGSAPTKNPR
jgi:starch-binding outer membrane protein, SusD/RagB family